ncbi:MAG: hypothetical protein WC619_00810 [Patescibacteria group bacterium]
MRGFITSQMEKCFRAGLFQNPGTRVEKQRYLDLLWSFVNRGSYPEFLPPTPADCLSPVLVLPRTFTGCQDQMELIERSTNGRVSFNELNRTITVGTEKRTIIFSNVDFSSWHTALSVDQLCWPYLLIRPVNLERLEEKFDEFLPEEVLAIIFQCTA